MDYTKRFDGKGEIYAKARPKYAPGLFGYLQNTLRIPVGSVFADVGSGTGIFTRQLLQSGYRVFAVEPNGDMRKKAEDALLGEENFRSVNGSAADTHLSQHSVEHVTAAQAFHWFDADAFRQECRRILKPGGNVMIVYNARKQDAPCTQALAEVRRRYNPDFHGFSNGMSEEKCLAFFAGECTVYRADNTLTYDRQGYIDRALSSSYSLKEGDDGYGAYLCEINRIFDLFSVDGRIAIPTDTVAYIGSV